MVTGDSSELKNSMAAIVHAEKGSSAFVQVCYLFNGCARNSPQFI